MDAEFVGRARSCEDESEDMEELRGSSVISVVTTTEPYCVAPGIVSVIYDTWPDGAVCVCVSS